MLKERILPIAKEMQGATWAQIIEKCYGLGVDLSAKYMYVIGLLDFLRNTNMLFVYLFTFVTRARSPQQRETISVGSCTLTHPVKFPCGRKPENPEKTHDFQQSVDFSRMRTRFESD